MIEMKISRNGTEGTYKTNSRKVRDINEAWETLL